MVNVMNDLFRRTLTSAVGESPVTRDAHGAVSSNHVGSAATLTAKAFTGVALSSDFVAGTRQRAVVNEG